VLDVVFRDDLARLRTGHGPANMAVVRHMSLNLLKRAKATISLKNRRKRAGWNTDYLAAVIPAGRLNVHSIPLPGRSDAIDFRLARSID